MADVHWMTYAELSEALSIGLDSAKNLARRKRWGRQRGNDGLAKIGVPREVLERRPKPMASVAADGPLNPPTSPPPLIGGVMAHQPLRSCTATSSA